MYLTLAALNLKATEVPTRDHVDLHRPTMNDRLHFLRRQPRRISITLSYQVHESLLQRSEQEGRSMSNLCAFLLEDALRHNNQPLLPVNTLNPAAATADSRMHKRAPF